MGSNCYNINDMRIALYSEASTQHSGNFLLNCRSCQYQHFLGSHNQRQKGGNLIQKLSDKKIAAMISVLHIVISKHAKF